jgi:hypothetical protein
VGYLSMGLLALFWPHLPLNPPVFTTRTFLQTFRSKFLYHPPSFRLSTFKVPYPVSAHSLYPIRNETLDFGPSCHFPYPIWYGWGLKS